MINIGVVRGSGIPNYSNAVEGISNVFTEKIRQTLLAGNYKGISKPTKQCIYCGKIFAGHIISRFHNEKCKSLLPAIVKKPRIAWNKGLSKDTDARVAELSKKVSTAKTGVKRGPYKNHK